MSDDFEAHFDNLVTAPTHSKEIVQGTLNHLTCSANNQHSEIKKLLAEIKSVLPSIGGQNSGDGSGTNATHINITAEQK